jgi:muramoyltetrapeptide carboxypeptidase
MRTFGVLPVLLFGFASSVIGQEGATEELRWLKPAALKPGDTVAIVAPAGPAVMETVLKYAKLLESSGYKVRLPKNGDDAISYLSGTDEQRAAELNAAIRDPEVRAIMPCRGGYGLTRILERIDYAALRKDPKIITGFSDLTALHLAAARRARVITFHSPMPMYKLWNEEKPYAFAAASFRRAVFAASYPKGETGYLIAMPEHEATPVRPARLVGGKAKGRLVGGNLTLICATLGTPYAIEAKGNLLFIEDVDEPPYRIDRYLSQLRLAGILDSVSGVIVGGFSVKTPKDGPEIDDLVREYLGKSKVPVLTKFPVGHQINNATLPHGAMAELDADRGTLTLLENPVRLD